MDRRRGESALLYASRVGWAPLGMTTTTSLTEVLGFVTGGACVYLTVRENVWNFPVGIANSVFFLFTGRLHRARG